MAQQEQQHYRNGEKLHVPKLNTTDWTAPVSPGLRSSDLDSISPRSRDDRGDGHELSSFSSTTPRTVTKSSLDTSSLATSVSRTKTTVDQHQGSYNYLDELRSIIRQEGQLLLIEGIQRLEAHGVGYVSDAVGSVVPSPLLHHVHTVPAVSGEADAAPSVSPRPPVRSGDRRVFSEHPFGAARSISAPQPLSEWGILFDEHRVATQRLGSVLRALAQYIVGRPRLGHNL